MFSYVLIDGMNLCHRFFWVHKNLKDNKDRSTGLLYGVLNFVLKLIKDYSKSKIYFLWDGERLKKKQENYNYKADRIKNDDIYSQVNLLKEYLKKLNIYQASAFGYEADDLAARFISKKYNKKILLISNDSDWIFPMNDNVYIQRKNKIQSRKEILKELNFETPQQFQYFSAIVGTHNNIKGIPYFKKEHAKKISLIMAKKNSLDIKEKDLTFELKKSFLKIKENKELLKSNFNFISPIIKNYSVEIIKGEENLKELSKIFIEHNMNSLLNKVLSI